VNSGLKLARQVCSTIGAIPQLFCCYGTQVLRFRFRSSTHEKASAQERRDKCREKGLIEDGGNLERKKTEVPLSKKLGIAPNNQVGPTTLKK
jgi:hypothetical protein